jgi:DNA-binding beta-propeller fold protein YncE
MRKRKMMGLLLVILPLLLGAVVPPSSSNMSPQTRPNDEIVDLGNGQTIEVAPDEVLMKYIISDIPSSQSGNGNPLIASEYGTRTDTFSNERMVYYPASPATTANLSVPVGSQWQGYSVYADVNSITENRSWLLNPNFDTDTTWQFRTSYEEGDFNGNNRIQYFTSGGTYTGQWGSRGTGNSQFIDPWGAAFDSSDNLYVADTQNNRIQVFNSAGTYLRQWGSFGTGNGQFNRPTGVAIDGSGLVYVVDSGNDRIQVFNSQGVYQSQWGSSGINNGEFRSPTGIAYSSYNGYLYITDTGNDRVQYFNTAGVRQGGWTGLSMPTGIAVRQSNGNVFVADTSANRVVQYTETGGASGVSTITGIYTPLGVAVSPDSAYLYVCTTLTSSPYNHVVRRYNAATDALQTTWGSTGSGNGQFEINYGIAVSSTGNVYTSEAGGTERMDANWLANGHGTGNPSSIFQIDGYWHRDTTSGLYGYWYNPGDKAFVMQDLVVDRGDITWAGVTLDYYADCRGWGSYMTGFFELFVSSGDPDHGGSYLWSKQFDDIDNDNTWYSTGLIPVDYSELSFPDVQILAGLRVAQSEWYRSADIRPEGRLDNIVVYIKAKATPTDINLKMNGVDVSNVYSGPTPIFGLGTVAYTPSVPWTSGSAYANFSWTPSPNPPVPNLETSVFIDVDVTVYARRYNAQTISNTELFTYGDSYSVENGTLVQWETNHYVAIPGGYEENYFYNVSIPFNRDINFVSEPAHRYTNLTDGWEAGDVGDGFVNISVNELGLPNPNGFWMIRGTSPNMISNVQVWDNSLGQWVQTKVFRADELTRFRAILSPAYQNDQVTFTIYNSTGEVWDTLTASVDSSGYAISGYVTLDAVSASVGSWEVQAVVDDHISSTEVHNIGFYRRGFSIVHATQLSVKYPISSRTSWSINVTYGTLVYLQFRVNDTDNGDLLSGGLMTYSWALGGGNVGDLGTGEYGVSFDTGLLSSNGRYDVDLSWSKAFYDSLFNTFTINVIYETELLSSDAPGIDVASGNTAQLHVYFEDMLANPITSASVLCNWSQGYTVTPDGFGNYLLNLDTTGMTLAIHAVLITASKNYYETRSIILTVDVRELHTSAIPSTSLLSLPVGYTTSFTVTYRDTDLGVPITGAAGIIRCNWSDIHSFGDQNYTVVETATPGVYQVTIYSMDNDALGSYEVLFKVERYGAQNQSFYVTVELRTHLTSLYLENSVDPTPYTGNITVNLVYYDVDASTGIVNGTTLGGYVELIVTSPTLASPTFYVASISPGGIYAIHIPASQWLDTGQVTLNFEVNWIGVNLKFSNLTLSTKVLITSAPTDLFIGESPVVTPYGEDISFSIIYFDVGASTGVVNGTGPYAGNVHIYIDVLTAGETLTQADMLVQEIDYTTHPGEYRITFDSSLLSGLGSVELKIWVNWTLSELPYYKNQVIVVTVYTSRRLTTVDWNPLPLTPYDEHVNLTFIYRDSLSGLAILNSSQLSISVPGYPTFKIYYDGNVTGIFLVEVDTSAFSIGSQTFALNVIWTGKPYYQNRTNVQIFINVRERYTDLTHGSYEPIQIGNTLNLNFTYRDLDDYSTSGMNGGTLLLDAWLSGNYTVDDLGNGNYTLHLDTSAFSSIGIKTINVTILYGGSRNCADATDMFYLSLTVRRTQLTNDLPDLAPFLSEAVIVIHYIDDTTDAGIHGASVTAACAAAAQSLQLGINYWVDDNLDGSYNVRINTTALGNFGPYTITVTVSWISGWPFYQQRVRNVDIEVSRRPATVTVSKSPLNTPFLSNVTFEITATDQLESTGISLTKTNLILTHGLSHALIGTSDYSISGTNGVYTISINSTVLTSVLIDDYPIYILFVWGDAVPYYANATSSTEVSIVSRYTQVTVLETPPGYYYFNISAILRFSDYLTGTPISGASISISSLNASSFDYWVIDNTDGTYTILIDSNDLAGLGRYFFKANVSWVGSPFYQDVNNVGFSISVNPVSTTLSFSLPEGVTYYLGDTVYANITYTAIAFGTGVTGATVMTDWFARYGTNYTITEISPGIYQMMINTSGLSAQLYRFNLNATKYLHLTQAIEAEILLASVPVEIELLFTPENPNWGDVVQFQANVTDARTGLPVIGASVNLTIGILVYDMTSIDDGLYNCTVTTASLTSGEYTVRIQSSRVDYESRVKDFQIRINKIAAKITASIDPQSAVDGKIITIEVDYLDYSSSLPIYPGNVTFSWVGGTGVVPWSGANYNGTFIVSGADVGSYQILIQASSSNHKSVSIQITIEITETTTEIVPVTGVAINANFRDIVNITVYLNNTDLGLPVTGATLYWGAGNVTGTLSETATPGYYLAQIDTTYLSVQEYTVSISSVKPGYTPSSFDYTLTVEQIESEIVLLTSGTLSGYYGQTVTFYFLFRDTYLKEGIPGGITNYTLEQFHGSLVDFGNGTYGLTLNTSLASAGAIPHDILLSFRKENYKSSYGLVKLLVMPIPSQVIGTDAATFPFLDNYSMLFNFRDSLNDAWITDAVATAVWEFGTATLVNLHNGSYAFGPNQANLASPLQFRDAPYRIRISFSRANYSRMEFEYQLTIRKIHLDGAVVDPKTPIYVGDLFYVNVTVFDKDHSIMMTDAVISVITSSQIDNGLIHEEAYDINWGNGTYSLAFRPPNLAFYTLRIEFTKPDYDVFSVEVDVYARLSPAQEALVQGFQFSALGLLAIAGLAVLYIRVLSVPRLLRILRRMVSILARGRIPKPANVPVRRNMILAMMNEELADIRIVKTIDDVSVSTVDVTAMDVEGLLEELAVVVGLAPSDVDTLRRDLDQMRPSERAGFINEVLKQERARRAKELAETEAVVPEGAPKAEVEEKLSEEELQHLKERLMKMGIEETEADLMVEQARNLSKAEIDALLREIGGVDE